MRELPIRVLRALSGPLLDYGGEPRSGPPGARVGRTGTSSYTCECEANYLIGATGIQFTDEVDIRTGMPTCAEVRPCDTANGEGNDCTPGTATCNHDGAAPSTGAALGPVLEPVVGPVLGPLLEPVRGLRACTVWGQRLLPRPPPCERWALAAQARGATPATATSATPGRAAAPRFARGEARLVADRPWGVCSLAYVGCLGRA